MNRIILKPFRSFLTLFPFQGWAAPVAPAFEARSGKFNYTNAFSDEQFSVEEIELSKETARVLSHVGSVLGNNDQKVVIIYNNEKDKNKNKRRPRPPPPQYSMEEEEPVEEEPEELEEEQVETTTKRRRPRPPQQYEYSSEEHQYRPNSNKNKRPEPQVIVIDKNSNSDKKAAIFDFLNKVGNKLNPLNAFNALNKKEDIIVYVDRPNRQSSEDNRPVRRRPRPRTTTTSTTTEPSTTESTTMSTTESTTTTTTTTTTTQPPPVEANPDAVIAQLLQDPIYGPLIQRRPPTARPQYSAGGIRRPTFTIRRPIVQDNQVYSQDEYDSYRSLDKDSSSKPVTSDKEDDDEDDDEIKRPYNFISVHRPYFDSCGRLWFIDSGSLEYSEKPVFYKKPTLWAFEVRRDKSGELESRPYLKYELKDSSYDGLRSLVVDIHGNCDFYHVYMPNQVDNQIVVYSSRRNSHWFFDHAVLKPVTTEEPLLKDGQGVSSLALGQRDRAGFRDVFVTIQSSLAQYKVSSRLLRDSSSSPDDFHFLRFEVLGYKPTGEYSTASAFDYKTNTLFLSTFPETTFNCWNTRKFLNPDSVGKLFTNPLPLNGKDVQVDREGNVRFLTNNKESFSSDVALNADGTNFEVYQFDIKDLIKGTICDPSKRDYRSLDVSKVEVAPEAAVEVGEELKPAIVGVLPEVKVSALKNDAIVKVEIAVKEE